MSHEITTLLGKDSEFEGKLRFGGVLRIDGRFKGEIQSDDTLALGPSAEVEAEVLVRTCVIEGRFSGNLTASESVEIRAPARVKGTVTTPEIQVERGVLLDGKCTMESMDSKDAGDDRGKGRSQKEGAKGETDTQGKAESEAKVGSKGDGGSKGGQKKNGRSGGGKKASKEEVASDLKEADSPK